jgi:hypothetical protein
MPLIVKTVAAGPTKNHIKMNAWLMNGTGIESFTVLLFGVSNTKPRFSLITKAIIIGPV